jgi:hypothetical protein
LVKGEQLSGHLAHHTGIKISTVEDLFNKRHSSYFLSRNMDEQKPQLLK